MYKIRMYVYIYNLCIYIYKHTHIYIHHNVLVVATYRPICRGLMKSMKVALYKRNLSCHKIACAVPIKCGYRLLSE